MNWLLRLVGKAPKAEKGGKAPSDGMSFLAHVRINDLRMERDDLWTALQEARQRAEFLSGIVEGQVRARLKAQKKAANPEAVREELCWLLSQQKSVD